MGGGIVRSLIEAAQRELQREYAEYLSAYFRARRDAIDAALDAGFSDLAADLERYSRPLWPGQFVAVRAAIGNLGSCAGCGAKEAQLLAAMLTDGRIFDNSRVVGPKNLGWSIVSVAAPALNLILLGPAAYNQTPVGMMFTLSHEAWHHFMPRESNEEVINAYACGSVPAAVQCRLLRRFQIIP